MLKQKKFSQGVFESIQKHIESRLPHVISMDELQKISGYSKRHINRLFFEYTNVSPSLYLKVMQAYRIILELKFTSISFEDICCKYKIGNTRNFKNKIELLMGENINELRVSRHIKFNRILKKNKIHLPKNYHSCSFVSLFDYEVQARGVKYSFVNNGSKMMSSHYNSIENIVQEFCDKYLYSRDKISVCAKFSPYDYDNYEVVLYTCILGGSPSPPPESESISLQGDYFLFTWSGYPEDTFFRVKNFYDVFFLKYQATRNEGFDIIQMKQVVGIRNYYTFYYYIPVVIDDAILHVRTT